MRKTIRLTIIAMRARPPTTPPAIAPASLLEVEVEVEVGPWLVVVDMDVVEEGAAAKLRFDYCWSERNDKDTYMSP